MVVQPAPDVGHALGQVLTDLRVVDVVGRTGSTDAPDDLVGSLIEARLDDDGNRPVRRPLADEILVAIRQVVEQRAADRLEDRRFPGAILSADRVHSADQADDLGGTTI